MAVLHRGERPDDAALPAAAAQAGQHVVARFAALAGHHADAARQRRARQPLLGVEQRFGVQRAAQPVELGEQVALAGDPDPADRERERRRRGPRAGVVVAAAGRDDALPVGQRRRERIEVLAPHRARQRPALVAQLEPHPRAARAEVEHLAEDLHAREPAQLLAEPVGVEPDRPRAAQGRAGDAVGTAGMGIAGHGCR
jgi:hypothetical protein